jgi:hypothetical protein
MPHAPAATKPRIYCPVCGHVAAVLAYEHDAEQCYFCIQCQHVWDTHRRDRELPCAAGELQHDAGLLSCKVDIERHVRIDRQ